MEWYKAAFFVFLFSHSPLFAEARKRIQAPIEVTLPTSANPLPFARDAKGKPVGNRNFPPLVTPDISKQTADVKNAATDLANKASQAASKATAPLNTTAESITDNLPGEIAPPDEITPSAVAAAPTTAAPAATSTAATSATAAQETPQQLLPAAAEAAVILSRNQFYPQRVHVPQGTRVRIWFTTVEAKPAALIVEGLQMQRWIASENPSLSASSTPGYFELQREVTRDRVTEITLQPSAGKYPFFDALSGARGEIVVE